MCNRISRAGTLHEHLEAITVFAKNTVEESIVNYHAPNSDRSMKSFDALNNVHTGISKHVVTAYMMEDICNMKSTEFEIKLIQTRKPSSNYNYIKYLFFHNILIILYQ